MHIIILSDLYFIEKSYSSFDILITFDGLLFDPIVGYTQKEKLHPLKSSLKSPFHML